MARRRKKSGSSGGGIAVLALAVIGMAAAVPKDVWIGAGVLLVLGLAIYFGTRSKKAEEERVDPPSLQPRNTPPVPAPSAVGSPPASPASNRQSPSPNPAAPARVADDAPMPVFRAPAAGAQSYRVPAAPVAYGPGRWIPAGQTVDVAGISLPGGMLYVGTTLSTASKRNDPCLIDPSKPVAHSGDYTERQMYYWPSYSDVSPTARRSYLNWLADGRKDPEADIGFVFLFFYGLERRAIVDAFEDQAAQADWPAIAAEVRRLLGIYGRGSTSFQNYAGSFLSWVELAGHPARLYERPVPSFPKSYELPLYVRLALGQAAVDGVPVPVHLAFAWAKLDPNVALRTAATRCPEEFEAFFAMKYSETYGKGMVLPKNKTKLKLVYQPASDGFRGGKELKLTFQDTPDITVLTAPIQKLKLLVEAATKPLDAFSRMVGKDPEAKSSLEGMLQLPASLWPEQAKKVLESLRSRMTDGAVALTFQELLNNLGAKTTFTRDKAVALARSLEGEGIGFEPDVLAGARLPKPEEPVVLFAQPKELLSRTDGPYLAAALTIQLASAVATADGHFGPDEKAHLRHAIQAWNHLPPEQTRRLLAHLQLMEQAPASLVALKKKFEPLDVAVKQTIARFMATVAQSDGEVSPAEVKMLEKVYKALGIDPNAVFSDIHAAAAGTKQAAATTEKVESIGFRLDPARIAALQQDTERVSALLANIFTEAETMPAPVAAPVEEPEPEPESEPISAPAGLLGLDESHAALARMLLSRPEWTREELLDIAADLDLMLDGALERINEAAFDAHDVPFFEGEDPVTVNAEFLEKVEA